MTKTNAYNLNKVFQQKQLKNDVKAEDLKKIYPLRWSELEFDISNAKYFDILNQDPVAVNKVKDSQLEKLREARGDSYVYSIISGSKHHYLKPRRFDMRLNDAEKSIFQKHGMVVSERLGARSFAEGYYRLYSDDLPVFITADSILHAWHRSFDSILKEVESCYLVPTLKRILSSMQSKLQNVGNKKNLLDVDYFIGVALAFLSQGNERTHCIMKENEQRYSATLTDITNQQTMEIKLFGKTQTVDFSQFKPRGHYDSNEVLRQYFQAMMWLGRIDFRLNGEESSIEQVQCAVTLMLLVWKSEEGMNLWNKFEETIRVFVGPVDSMTVAELNGVIEGMVQKGELNGIQSCDQLWTASHQTMEQIKLKLSSLDVGKQLINSALRHVPRDSTTPTALPQSFTFLGQRFTLDVFVMTKVVYDNIMWKNAPVQRRIPSALDVAFTVFQNDNVAEEISKRALNKKGMKFRDGLPYVHALCSMRETIDEVNAEQWSESLYTMWLDCLRKLSRASLHSSSTFHSEAWAMRVLNTQLASYTELKHDTVLYAKQGYTCGTLCEYADIFVEPNTEFWTSVRRMAERAADLLKKLNVYEGIRHHVSFFQHFAKIIRNLETASAQLSRGKKLSKKQVKYLKNVMEEQHGSGGSKYLGWYPQLFYSSREDSGEWDPLVADIHTNLPDETVSDPGCVVHQAVGNVFMGMFTVNFGTSEEPKPAVFAGPVFSYYEFNKPIDERMTDLEWRNIMRKNTHSIPPLPEWATSTYLAAGENPHTVRYNHKEDNTHGYYGY